MGNRANYPSVSGGSIGHEYREILIKLNGAAAPTILEGSSNLDPTKPPTHTGGTNVATLFMRDAYPKAIYIAAEPRDDTPNGAYCTVGTIANEGSTTVPATGLSFKVNTWTAGGAASNDSSLTIGIVLCLRNTNTTYGNTP